MATKGTPQYDHYGSGYGKKTAPKSQRSRPSQSKETKGGSRNK